MHSSQAKNVQQSIVKTNTDLRGNESQLSCSPCSFLHPVTPLYFEARGESRFPFSHMSIHKRHRHTEHAAGLFVGDFWPSLELSCPALTQHQKTKGFSEGIICLLKWTHKDGPSRSAWHNTVRAKTRYHVNRHFDAQSSHLYSLGCDSLSRSASSETNHKGSL